MRFAVFVVVVTLVAGCFSLPFIYEGIPLTDRIKVVKATENFIKSFEETLNRLAADVIESHKDALTLDISKIDEASDAKEFVYVITKGGEDAASYLLAPLAIPETVKEDTQNLAETFIEILLPAEDGSEPEENPPKENEETDRVHSASTLLNRFIRSNNLTASVSGDILKSLEEIQEALVYPSAFLKDAEESIPIDVILGLFKQINKTDLPEQQSKESVDAKSEPEANTAQSDGAQDAQKSNSHSDEM